MRPSKCCTDDINNGEQGKPKYLLCCTFRDYSCTNDRCLSAGNRKTGPLFPINIGAPVPKEELMCHENCCGCKRGIVVDCHSSSREQQSASGNSGSNNLYSKPPPWLWQCLLHKCPQKRLTDNKSGKGHEDSKDWRKKCHHEHFLHTHSVLQGLGWVSVILPFNYDLHFTDRNWRNTCQNSV